MPTKNSPTWWYWLSGQNVHTEPKVPNRPCISSGLHPEERVSWHMAYWQEAGGGSATGLPGSGGRAETDSPGFLDGNQVWEAQAWTFHGRPSLRPQEWTELVRPPCHPLASHDVSLCLQHGLGGRIVGLKQEQDVLGHLVGPGQEQNLVSRAIDL